MNYCPNCGNKLNPTDVLCSRCGSLVERAKASSYPQPANNAEICRPSTASADVPEADMTVPGQIAMPGLIPGLEDNTASDTDKLWLEIEEIDATAPAEEQAEAAVSETEAETEAEAEAEAEPGSAEEQLPAVPEEISPDDVETRRSSRRMQENAAPIDTAPQPRDRAAKKHAPGIVVLLIWILTTAAVFAGFYFADSYVAENYGGWDAFVQDFTKGKVELDISAAYLSSIKVDVSEAQTEDGAPAHRFDVTLADGKSIRVLPLGESYPMQNGSASFTVSDEALAKSLGVVTSDASMDTSGISLDVQTASQSFTYPITSLSLKLTDAQYRREKPSAETLTTTDTGLKITLTVSPDATVFINNSNHSEDIDDFGHLTATMPLELGEDAFVIEAIQPGRRSVKENFTITRELPAISLSLRDQYLRVYESSFECRGTSQAGATVTAMLDGKKFTALVGDDGVFSFACTLTNTGVYDMQVTAAKEGLADATAPVMVEYLPGQETYIEKTKEMTVDKIMKDINAVKGTDIKTTARIDGNITNENHTQSFTVISKDGATMSCYYYGPERLSAELEYTFCGVFDTDKNSFYVMFVE